MKKICCLLLLIFFFCLISTGFAQKKAYILDTDMGFDDWLAVLYVLSNPAISLKSVSIDCQGETYCPAGAVNASQLMALAHHQVPIFMGASREKTSYDFPRSIRDYASAMAVPGFNHLKSQLKLPCQSADVGIALQLVQAAKYHQVIDIISIGTATNIADAYLYAKKHHFAALFRQGLGMIYKGGGAFGVVEQGRVTNRHVPGNIPIPGIYQSNNKVAEWNIYANAKAMQVLLSAKLPITFIPNNATDAVPMSWAIYHRFKSLGVKNPMARFIAGAMQTLFALQHSWEGLNFWDTAVTVAAIYPSVVSTIYQAPVHVVLKNARHYGETAVSTVYGAPTKIFYKVSAQAIYQHLFPMRRY